MAQCEFCGEEVADDAVEAHNAERHGVVPAAEVTGELPPEPEAEQ